jgi:hypothetical protein
MKQHEAVIQAMKENGGYATLGQLYGTATRVSGSSWGTETPDASIRRIVQERPEFFKIKPGLWALKSEKAEVLKKLSGNTPEQRRELNHSYYQGLIVQLGNFKNFETFVPNQDKNKQFLPEKTLSSISTLEKFHDFTYKHIIRRGRTVDVTWFNERKLPDSFFEVGDSTDFYNSLLKFLEFQDFLIDFHVVADSNKRNNFDRKLAYSAFKPIRQRVKFLSYEKLAKWHSTTSASIKAEESLYL